jgi:hypothetical protein
MVLLKLFIKSVDILGIQCYINQNLPKSSFLSLFSFIIYSPIRKTKSVNYWFFSRRKAVYLSFAYYSINAFMFTCYLIGECIKFDEDFVEIPQDF